MPRGAQGRALAARAPRDVPQRNKRQHVAREVARRKAERHAKTSRLRNPGVHKGRQECEV
eukprot:5139605-Prymnesium_polylepis.3